MGYENKLKKKVEALIEDYNEMYLILDSLQDDESEPEYKWKDLKKAFRRVKKNHSNLRTFFIKNDLDFDNDSTITEITVKLSNAEHYLYNNRPFSDYVRSGAISILKSMISPIPTIWNRD